LRSFEATVVRVGCADLADLHPMCDTRYRAYT
jgi:hypothetical protein